LRAHHLAHSDDERIFGSAYSAFREGMIDAKLKLSDGQLTHILRHTFASHFIMNGGNTVLQKLLGDHSLAMTIRLRTWPPIISKKPGV
jgi:integrase